MTSSLKLTSDKVSAKDKKIGLWLAILVFVRSQPCYLWAFEDILRPICAILVLIICATNISHEKWSKWIFLCLASAYIWASAFVDHTGVITLFNFLVFAFIPILKKKIVFETYAVFYKIMVFFLGLSIINYFFYHVGLAFGGISIPPLNPLKSYHYIMYPFLVVPSIPNIRFFGIFDEPGVVGTMCAIILVAEKMNFRKTSNIIILMAGILSMSMFFYLSLAMSIVLFTTNNKQRLKFTLFILSFLIITYSIPAIYDKLWSRFEYDSTTGTFAGDNRSGGAVGIYFLSIIGSSKLFLGHGSEFIEQFQGEASLLLTTIKYGLIFVILILCGYGMLAYREINNKKNWGYFMIFFIMTIYQRPGFLNTYSIFLYTMLIYMYAYHNVKQINPLITKR